MDGIVPINSKLSNSTTACSQLGLNGQDSKEFASGTTLLKENEINYDSQLIIPDAKQKRWHNGPHPIVGLEEVDNTTMMESSDVAKNKPAVGLVNQAHRDQ